MKRITSSSCQTRNIIKLLMMVKSGIEHARVITRARVLLLAHGGKIDKEIAGIFSLSTKTPYEIMKRYHAGGIDSALYDRSPAGTTQTI